MGSVNKEIIQEIENIKDCNILTLDSVDGGYVENKMHLFIKSQMSD